MTQEVFVIWFSLSSAL